MKKHQRIWGRKVLKVLETYDCNRELFLFGVTGDFDDLGVFVSRYGRPLAENLVDIYNRLIGAFMYRFIKKHSKVIPAFCMIPSGEEIFATGVATNRLVVNDFFLLLGDEVNNFIKENAPLADEDVTVSFGYKIFSSDMIGTATSRLVELVRTRRVQEASLAYLELMLVMRRELAYELDRAKFNFLNASDLNLITFFRNVVYAKLQNYKKETREALITLADRLNHDAGLRERLQTMALNLEYGITDEGAQLINELLAEK
ncbi:MAG: hypothetical protein UU78_C0067G0004 [Candidatus Roizmanbacteria bacterium GW2011_GWC2_41_7]|uniref:GGDEF domain-containing protein n=1 Tax=Candidatus Roizmanbacteria bacterium GW2011_GWC2_41_7 TaxID=1618487 RepID=A0A0G0X4Y5_9BACT|nr:MAG: hypothetical protein UU78_C0067G0004 [Candidatus Roizmanbacteria bacterium GW2011_GWC2_41_7]